MWFIRSLTFFAYLAATALHPAPASADAESFAPTYILQIIHRQTDGLTLESASVSMKPCDQAGIDSAKRAYDGDVRNGDPISGHAHATSFAEAFAFCALLAETKQQFFMFADMTLVEMANEMYSDHSRKAWTGADVAKGQQARRLAEWIINNADSARERNDAMNTLSSVTNLMKIVEGAQS